MNRILQKYGNTLLIAFVISSVFGLLVADTPFNALFVWTGRHLALPIVVLVAAYTFLNRRELISLAGSRLKVYAFAAILTPLFVLFSAGYVNLVNALGANRPVVLHHGTIHRKFETRGRSHGWHVEIFDEAIGRPETFNVSEQTYESLRVGEHFSRTMRDGLLGIPYRIRGR